MSDSNGNTNKMVLGNSTPTAPTTASNMQAELNALGGDGNLLKVRDLLFGSQQREIEHRFSALEEKVHAMEQASAANLKRAVSTLEARLSTERQESAAKLKRARREHDEALTALRREFDKQAGELTELTRKMDKRSAAVEEDIDEVRKVMESKLAASTGKVSEDVSRAVSQINSSLEQAVHRLQDQKADRAFLSEWMMDMALRLSNQGNENQKNRTAITARKPSPPATGRPSMSPQGTGHKPASAK